MFTYRFHTIAVSFVWVVILSAISTSSALAQEPASVNAGHTGWVLTSSALVLAMIVPGLALFYGGMVRSKNVLSTMMHSFIAICLVSVVWVFWGYGLAFGPDVAGIIGNLDFVGLVGVGLFFGNPGQFFIQILGVGATWIFAGVGTFVIFKLVDGVVGLRVSTEEEVLGLDLTEHSERAYG